MKLAVIPARGGSKRIPRKNIRPFCDKPIIAWSIAAARGSGCFDRVVVSTDDAEIAEVARQAGAEVPFTRPAELSSDHTATIPVIRHAIQWLATTGVEPELVCCIYATAPFLRAEDLRAGRAMLESGDADFVFSVTKYAFPIQRALRVDARGRVAMFQPESFHIRSQDLEQAYHDAGQFYWGRTQAWKSTDTLFGPSAAAMLLPTYRVQDIDTPEDWTRAEWLFRVMQNEP